MRAEAFRKSLNFRSPPQVAREDLRAAHTAAQAQLLARVAAPEAPPPPPPRTNRTRRVPHPVLIGHAASRETSLPQWLQRRSGARHCGTRSSQRATLSGRARPSSRRWRGRLRNRQEPPPAPADPPRSLRKLSDSLNASGDSGSQSAEVSPGAQAVRLADAEKSEAERAELEAAQARGRARPPLPRRLACAHAAGGAARCSPRVVCLSVLGAVA
jgi:hypothetical protein